MTNKENPNGTVRKKENSITYTNSNGVLKKNRFRYINSNGKVQEKTYYQRRPVGASPSNTKNQKRNYELHKQTFRNYEKSIANERRQAENRAGRWRAWPEQMVSSWRAIPSPPMAGCVIGGCRTGGGGGGVVSEGDRHRVRIGGG